MVILRIYIIQNKYINEMTYMNKGAFIGYFVSLFVITNILIDNHRLFFKKIHLHSQCWTLHSDPRLEIQ